MEKRNVFVHIKTIYECKELYKMLKKMNQVVDYNTNLDLKTGQLDYPYIYLQYPDVWCGHSEKPSIKEVSVKQLNDLLIKLK